MPALSMRRLIRPLLAAGLLAGLAAAAPAPVTTAGAVTRPGITIAPGQELELDMPAIPGQGYPYARQVAVANFTPEACADDVGVAEDPTAEDDPTQGTGQAFCDTIPLTLNVPDIKAHDYLVTVTMTWDDKPTGISNIPNFGTLNGSQMRTLLWRVPYVKDEDGVPDKTPLASTGGVGQTSPAGLAYVNPDVATLALTTVNYYGANEGYHLRIALIDLGTRFVDFSDGSFSDFSDISSVPVTPNFTASPDNTEGLTTPFLPALTPGPNSNFAGGSALSNLGDAGAPAGLDEVANILSTSGFAKPPVPGPVSGGMLLFWLIAFPVLLLMLLGGWLRRSRKDALEI
jgi:hypothetical protein